MIIERRTRTTAVVMCAAVLLAATTLAGCGQTPATTPKSGPTALGSLASAQSALATQAPDAKLLVVQTARAASPTSTPVWAYLFGSPSSGKTYLVYLSNGKTMSAQEAGRAGLSAGEWAKVPGTESWAIDSDAAYSNALAVSGAKGVPAAYIMGFITFKPSTDTSTVEPFVWRVQFDPGTSGATTRSIDVDAKTGAAQVAK